MEYNLVLDVDSYKASHWLQYPKGTQGLYSYLESRGGRYGQTVFLENIFLNLLLKRI